MAATATVTASSTLPSTSFLLTTTTPHSRLLLLKTPRQLTVFGKNKNKGISNSKDDTNSNPFQFNWANISDVKSVIPVVTSPPPLAGLGRRKDASTVFVAGATGQVGSRVSQMLLRQGFKVRAGVPDLGAAQDLARFASHYKIISPEESRRLNAVQSVFEDTESIAKAIGNASKVVVTIGSTENGPSKEVTTADALQVVEAAQLAGVTHVVIIYDGSASTVSTNNALNRISSFFSNFFSKSQPFTVFEFLQRVIQTDVKFTFIKTALTDDFCLDKSYNVVVVAEGSAASNDYKVPRSQMAALVAGLFSNTEVAEDKVVEIFTDPLAPLKSPYELFSVIPEDGRRKAYAEAVSKAKAEEAAVKAAEQAREAEDAKKRAVEAEAKRKSEQEARAAAAKQKVEEVGASFDNFFNKAKDLGAGLSWEKLGSQFATSAETPDTQVATVRGQARARNLPSQKAVIKQAPTKSRPKPVPRPSAVASEDEKPKDQAREVRNILGGLFKQETVYVDDD